MAVHKIASPLAPIARHLAEPGHPRIGRASSVGCEGFTQTMKATGEASRSPLSPSQKRGSPSLSSRSLGDSALKSRKSAELGEGPRIQQIFQRRPDSTPLGREGFPEKPVSPLPSLMHRNFAFADLERATTRAVDAMREHPIKAAFGGEGPTFVLDTPECVLKSTTPQEMAFQLLYREFGFLAPRSQAVDFEREIQFNESAIRDLDADHLEAVQNNFAKIARASRATVNPEKSVLMYSERIRGQNLFDFARFTYQKLSEDQKIGFFRQLGQIAMLDFVCGQFDRLFEVYFDEKYILDIGAANLGNVLVVFAEGPLRLYPIDNGIDPALMTNQEGRQEKVADFLDTFLKSDAPLESLATHIADHFNQAIDQNCDEDQWTKPKSGEKPNRNLTFREFQGFCNDLKRIAIPALIEGLGEKRRVILQTYVATFNRIGKHLDSICPGFCKQVMRRFALLRKG